VLLVSLFSANPAVRRTAATGLARAGRAASLMPLLEAARHDRDPMFALRAVDSAAAAARRLERVDLVLETGGRLFQHPAPGSLYPRLLARLGTERSVALLVELSRSSSPETRRTALRALALVPFSMVPVDAVRERLTDPDPAVFAAAAEALAGAGDLAAYEELLSLAKDSDTALPAILGALSSLAARPATASLAELEAAFVEEVRPSLEAMAGRLASARQGSTPVAVRRAAIASLGRIRDRSAFFTLADLALGQETEIAPAACRALVAQGFRAAPPVLLACLRRGAPSVTSTAHRGLQQLTGKLLPLDPEAWERALEEARPDYRRH
jgi:HEAT repeat protein